MTIIKNTLFYFIHYTLGWHNVLLYSYECSRKVDENHTRIGDEYQYPSAHPLKRNKIRWISDFLLFHISSVQFTVSNWLLCIIECCSTCSTGPAWHGTAERWRIVTTWLAKVVTFDITLKPTQAQSEMKRNFA